MVGGDPRCQFNTNQQNDGAEVSPGTNGELWPHRLRGGGPGG